MRDRLTITTPARDRARDDFASDVRAGLTAPPRRLACRWFYDDAGSALFEAICELPEYYPFRTERAILEKNAAAIAGAIGARVELVELGSGNSHKTALVIDALLKRQASLSYVPIDVARSALTASARSLLPTRPTLTLHAIEAEYDDGLACLGSASFEATRDRREAAHLILWLGSNVGNLDRDAAAAFLGRVRRRMSRRDRFLLGADLRKDARVLERAYDDAAGVTAKFNLNVLTRVNRELDADFDVAAFAHEARYDEALGRIAMNLVAREQQRVSIRALGLTLDLARGERIHTENCWKYSFEELEALAQAASLRIEERWIDADGRFCDALLAPI